MEQVSGYLLDEAQVSLISGVPMALKTLSKMGYKLFIVTNQGAIAKDLITEERVREINRYILQSFKRKGVEFHGLKYCPHHPLGRIQALTRECECRKPRPGMLLELANMFGIDLDQSWMVGDNLTDVTAGKQVGCRTTLVLTGHGKNFEVKARGYAEWICKDVRDFARRLIQDGVNP